MSVTFSVEDATYTQQACPVCDAHYPENIQENGCSFEMEGADSPCYGMGFTFSSTYSFNVANTNARLILDMMGYDFEDLCGNLDPHDVVRRMAVAVLKTRETVDNHGVKLSFAGVMPTCRVVHFGVSADQSSRYRDQMFRVAQDAIAAGKRITFG